MMMFSGGAEPDAGTSALVVATSARSVADVDGAPTFPRFRASMSRRERIVDRTACGRKVVLTAFAKAREERSARLEIVGSLA